MTKRLTKRYIVNTLENLNLSTPIHYERYYINQNLRIQKKQDKFEKEILDDNNVLIKKETIQELEFNVLKKQAYQKLIRESYLYLDDTRISIKTYKENYEGLNRVEVSFERKEEMEHFQKLPWMGKEITNSPLAFDVFLSKLTKEEFQQELKKYVQ